MFDLPVGLRVKDMGVVELDVALTAPTAPTFDRICTEIRPVIGENTVGHVVTGNHIENEIKNRLGFLGSNRLRFDPLYEFVDHYEQVLITALSLMERFDHVQPLDRERPGYQDSF